MSGFDKSQQPSAGSSQAAHGGNNYVTRLLREGRMGTEQRSGPTSGPNKENFQVGTASASVEATRVKPQAASRGAGHSAQPPPQAWAGARQTPSSTHHSALLHSPPPAGRSDQAPSTITQPLRPQRAPLFCGPAARGGPGRPDQPRQPLQRQEADHNSHQQWRGQTKPDSRSTGQHYPQDHEHKLPVTSRNPAINAPRSNPSAWPPAQTADDGIAGTSPATPTLRAHTASPFKPLGPLTCSTGRHDIYPASPDQDGGDPAWPPLHPDPDNQRSKRTTAPSPEDPSAQPLSMHSHKDGQGTKKAAEASNGNATMHDGCSKLALDSSEAAGEGLGGTGTDPPRFTLAQSEQTRWLKDTARMSHMQSAMPATGRGRQQFTSRATTSSGSTGASALRRNGQGGPMRVGGERGSTGSTGGSYGGLGGGPGVPQRPRYGSREDGGQDAGYGGGRAGGDRGSSGGRSAGSASLDANVAAMFAKAGNDWKGILAVIRQQLDCGQLTPPGVAGALHRLGAAAQSGDIGSPRDARERALLLEHPTFGAIKAEALREMPLFTARNVANALWGLARLGHAPPDLMAAACSQAVACLDEANPQNVSNTLWALGALPYNPGPECLDALLARAVYLRWDLLPQHLSNILLSVAKLEHDPGPEVMAALADEACNKLHEFAPQALANSVWACARLGFAHPSLLEGVWRMVSDPSTPVWRQLNAQNWGNLAWAYANLGVLPAPDMLEQVCAGMLTVMSKAAPQNLTNLAWALAKLNGVLPMNTTEPGTPPSSSTTSWAFLQEKQQRESALESLGDISSSPTHGGPIQTTDCSSPARNSLTGGLSQLMGARRNAASGSPVSSSGQLTLSVPGATGWDERGCSTGTRSGVGADASSSGARLAPGSPGWEGEELLGSSTGAHGAGTATQAVGRSVVVGAWDGDRSPVGSLGAVTSLAAGSRKEQFMVSLTHLASHTMHTWQSQAVSNLTWACAALGMRPEPAYLTAVAARMRGNIAQWPIQHVSNTLWALATMGHHDPQLMTHIAGNLVTRLRVDPTSLETFKPQHVSNMLWAYGTLEVPAPELFTLLLHSLISRLSAFSCQEISNSCWAMARLAHYDCGVMDAVAQHVAGHRIHQLLPQHISNLAWAYGRLTHLHTGLMVALAKTAMMLIKSLSSQHLSNMVCSYAMLALEQPAAEFLAACRKEILTRCGAGGLGGRRGMPSGTSTFNSQQVTNVLWGLSLLGVADLPLWTTLMNVLRNQLDQKAEDLPEEALTQVYQAYLLLLLEDIKPKDLHHTALPGLLEVAEQCWRQSVAKPIISAMHREVSNTLAAMGIKHVNEQLTDDGLFSVDVAVRELPPHLIPTARGPETKDDAATGAGRPVAVAVEVDGPSHFAANSLCQELGVTRARRRCLAARGWTVVSVAHTAWAAAHTLPERTALIERLVLRALQE